MNHRKFSPEVKQVISNSRDEALRLAHDFIGTEHLLLGIIEDNNSLAIDTLFSLDIAITELRQAIEEVVSRLPIGEGASLEVGNLPLNKAAEKVLKLTFLEAKMLEEPEIGIHHLVLSILKHKENPAEKVLNRFDVDYDIYKAELEYVRKERDYSAKTQADIQTQQEELPFEEEKESDTPQLSVEEVITPILDQFSVTPASLIKRSQPFSLAFENEEALGLLTTILCRRSNKHVLIVGEPEMGMNSILLKLSGETLDIIGAAKYFKAPRVIFLDLDLLFNPMKRENNDYAAVLMVLLDELEQARGKIILCIRNMHRGLERPDFRLDFIKFFIENDDLRIIYTIPRAKYTALIENDPTLKFRFSLIRIKPPVLDDIRASLHLKKNSFQEQYPIVLTDEIIDLAIDLANTFYQDKDLPQSSLTLIDEICAEVHLNKITIPEHIDELEKRINVIKQLKNFAVKDQSYERAADLRDDESKMVRKLEFAKIKWEEDLETQRFQITIDDVFAIVSRNTGISIADLKSKMNQ